MTTSAANLKIRGDIRDLKAAITGLPVEMQKEATKALRALETESKKMERAIARATKPAGPNLRDTREGVEGLKTAMEGLGGAGAPAADSVSKLLDGAMKLGAVAGPAGLAVGAVTTAIVAFTGAGFAAALQSSALIEELDTMGRAEAITEEQRGRVGAMDVALRELRVATSEATVAFGSEFAPAITQVATGLTVLIDRGTAVASVWGDLIESTAGLRRAMAAIGTLGASEALGLFDEASSASTEAAYKAEEAVRQQRVEIEALAAAYSQGEAIVPRVTKATEGLATAQRDAAKAAKEHEAELARIQSTVTAMIAAQSDAEAAATKERLQRQAEALKIEAAANDRSRAIELAKRQEAHEMQMAMQQAGIDQLTASLESMPSVFAEVSSMIGQAAAEQADAEEARLERTKQRQIEAVERQLELGRIDERQAQQRIRAIEQEAKADKRAIKDREKARKVAAQVAFAAYKAGAIAQALISGANAYLAVLAAPPIAALGPFAPAAAAAVVGPATATQVAAIALQKPQFHGGGMVMSPGADDVPATLRRGEAVLTPGGVARAGGPAGVDALNNGGGMPFQGAQNITIHLTLPSGEVATTQVQGVGGTVHAALRTTPGQRPYDGRR